MDAKANSKKFDSMKSFYDALPAGVVIEVGAGRGRVLKAGIARRNDVSVDTANALRLQFENGSCAGAIFAPIALTDVTPSIFILAELHRVLRDNGGLCLMVQSPGADKWRGILEDLNFEVKQVSEGIIEDHILPDPSPTFVFQCTKRGTDKTPRQTFLRDAYDGVAGNYDKFANGGKYAIPAWFTRKLAFHIKKSPKVLDLGCANGYLGKHLLNLGIQAQCFGVDYSSGMTAEASKQGIYLSAMTFDLSNGFPMIEENFFDLILACGIFEFVDSPQELLKDISRLLQKTGKALITFEQTPTSELQKDRREKTPQVIYYSYTETEIVRLLNNAHLEVESIEQTIGYTSPSNGHQVRYFLVEAKKNKSYGISS